MALFNGWLGVGVCIGIALHILDWDLRAAVLAVLLSNIAAFVSLSTTLKVEKTQWLRAKWLSSTLRTWIVLLGLYIGLLTLFFPPLRTLKSFLWLIFPLILSTGFAIIVFGPIQDYWVKKAQRKNFARQ